MKPCPFCGHPHPQIVDADLDKIAYSCVECGAIGPAVTGFKHKTGEQPAFANARAAWDKREAMPA